MEALERARAAYGTGAYDDATIEFLFPEVKENEDEWIRKWLIEMVEELRKENPTNAEHNGNCSEAIAYLENQKEQKPAEWSEEDELMRTAVIQTLERFGGRGATGMQIAWLKSLRPQPKIEWSEEDEAKKERLISIVKRALHRNNYPILNDNDATELIYWLKSFHPQPHWKPSKEQMEAPAWYSGNSGVPPTGGKAIKSLYNDLKKL